MTTATEESPLVSFGRRLGRHSGIYAASAVTTFFFGLVNMAALTRMLPIEEFGRLAVYLLLATLLSTLYNLGSLQGILICVFGVADGAEELGLDEAEGEPRAVDRERALTTGVLLTVAIAALGTAIVFAAAPVLADLLGAPGELEAVRLAALCGATGAVWRLVHNVARLERRPGLYSVLNLARPILALGLGVTFVVAGLGVEGALAGIALGTALAVPVAIAVERHNYALGLDLSIVPEVFRRGAFVVPIILSMWIVTNVDLFFVNAYAPDDAVGPYRVASRLGAGVSYLISAVTMAWLPLRRIPLHTAMNEKHGVSGFGATLLTAFLLVCIWVVLGLTLLADVLIGIAPESYSDAAPLVPLVGLGIVASGVLVIVDRGAKLPNRRRTYIGLLLAAAVVFVAAGLILVPMYGGYGAAAAQIIAFTAAAAAILWLAQRSEHPLPIPYGKLARGVALGLLCIGLGQLVSPLAGDWRIAIDLAILIAFPALLYAVGAFPGEELRAFVDLSRPGTRPGRASELVSKLGELEPRDRALVAMLAPKGASSRSAIRVFGGDERETMTRFVASLRALGPNGDRPSEKGDGAGERDHEIAAYLLAEGGVATRDKIGERLCEGGVDPLDLDRLDLTLGRLRRLPRDEWERLRPPSASVAGWSVANPGNRAARRELLEAINIVAAPQLRGGGALLDCGCGHGWLLEALADDGVAPERLHGVDLDPERVVAAERRVPGATVCVADARELPYPEESFDAVFHVVSLSSMGGRDSVRAALAESARVLSPGGVVVVYEPRFPNPLNRGTRRLGQTDLEAAGLSVAERRSLTLLPPLGRRLGPLTPALHPLLSQLPPLRSHRLLVHRADSRERRSPAAV